MIIALITTLFLIQLITIFVIVVLNSKLSKFNDLEKRQNDLVNEMDNAISVYLMEMREENDRLINELKKPTVISNNAVKSSEVLTQTTTEQPVSIQKHPPSIQQEEKRSEIQPRNFVPIKQAASAYKKHKAEPVENREDETFLEAQLFSKQDGDETIPLTFEQQVIAHYRNGKTIEEIAQMMQRGKTEIELLIKFHA